MKILPLLILGFFISNVGTSAEASQKTQDQKVQEIDLHSSKPVFLDRIDVNGVKSVNPNTIESSLGLAPGDSLIQERVDATRDNLMKLYHSYGYEEVKVECRLLQEQGGDPKKDREIVLEVNVQEGSASRLAAAEVIFEEADRSETQELQKKSFKDLKGIIPLAVGDWVDQEKVLEGKKAILDKLSSLEYVGSSVSAVQVLPSQIPSHLDSPRSESSSKWVTLKYQLKIGEKVWFGFQGHKFFTWGYLNGIVDDQKAIGLGKDYIETLKRKIEEEYRSNGFYYVKVDASTSRIPGRVEQRVTFLISEGPRVKIEEIDFDGNLNFSSEQLKEQFFSKASSLIQGRIYVDKEVQKAGDLLIEWLKEKGYLTAKLITLHSVFDDSLVQAGSLPSRVRITLYLHEGEQTRLRQLKIEGAHQISEQDLRPLIGVREGEPLNLFALSQGLEELRTYYKDRGYLDFQILNQESEDIIIYSREDRSADVTLKLSEGSLARVSKIDISGTVKTQEYVIQDQLLFKVDDVLTESKLQGTEKNLRKLGIFSSLNLRVSDDPSRPGYKVVAIKVQEADRGVLTWGPGVRTDLGLRVFSQFSYANLWGKSHTVSFSVNANRRFINYHFMEFQGQLSYIWPKFASVPDLVFRPSVTGGSTQYFDFAANTLVLASTWERHLFGRSNLLGSMTYSLESAHQFNSNIASDNQTYRVGSITPRVVMDFRDNPLSPSSGFYTTSWADFAFPLLGSGSVQGLNGHEYSVSYYRLQLRADYHLPLFKKLYWYFSFRTGFEKTTQAIQPGDGTTSLIPLIKQFALGGVGSLRGYRELELNYQSQNIPIQNSLSYVNYRTQLDFALSDLIRLGVFMDAANLLIDRYSFGRLYYTTGLGLHLQTPVGPVNLDWGFKLNQNPNSTESNFVHFSVGVI